MSSKEMMIHSGGGLKYIEVNYDWDIDHDLITILKVWDKVNKKEINLTENQKLEVISKIKD